MGRAVEKVLQFIGLALAVLSIATPGISILGVTLTQWQLLASGVVVFMVGELLGE